MRGSSPRMTAGKRGAILLLRRDRPRLLRAAQALERLGHAEHAEIVKALSDDLHADRKALFVVAAIDRGGRVLRHVPRHRVGDVLERFEGIVEWRGEFGRKIYHRRY